MAAVAEQWDDAGDATSALLALVAQHSCFAWAAAQLQGARRDPIADKQLERICARAADRDDDGDGAARARTERAGEQPYRDRRSFVLLPLLLLIAIVGSRLVVAMTLHDGRPAKHDHAPLR